MVTGPPAEHRRPSAASEKPRGNAKEDAEHVTKTEIRVLEQQIQTGFANSAQQITTGISSIEVALGKSNQRLAGVILGGIAIATTIIVAVLA